MFIGDYLARRKLYSPKALAFVDTSKDPVLRLTFAQANERADRLANFLRRKGVGKGDRVAVLARDVVENLDLFFACGKLGAIHVALNWRLHWQETLDILKTTTPKGLFFSNDFREAVQNIAAAQKGTQPGVAFFVHLDSPGITDSLAFNDLLASSEDKPVTCEDLVEEDTAALIFTGGTSGLPKGAMISHRMIAWNTLNTVVHDLHHGDVYLNVFPLFHTGGLFVYTLPLVILGGTTVLLRQFEPQKVLALIEQEKVTVLAAVPTMYQMLAQAPNWVSTDLSSLRFCTSGGAPLPVPIIEAFVKEKGICFKQGFGMTEFGPGIFALAPADAIRKAGSIGRPNFFVDARVVDENGHSQPPGEIGELVLKGPSFCSGYYAAPEATARMCDAAGWFHTGDLARCDSEGYFFIVDRMKDMFISGGENVYPVEIENAAYQHPAVAQCAVIGLPDPKWGEVGLACVILKAGQSITEEELLEFLKGRLARFKVPQKVVFLKEFPVSSAGKILKRELRERFLRPPAV